MLTEFEKLFSIEGRFNGEHNSTLAMDFSSASMDVCVCVCVGLLCVYVCKLFYHKKLFLMFHIEKEFLQLLLKVFSITTSCFDRQLD
jgi:hypothetical protein